MPGAAPPGAFPVSDLEGVLFHKLFTCTAQPLSGPFLYSFLAMRLRSSNHVSRTGWVGALGPSGLPTLSNNTRNQSF